jgi:predicted outer membrane protein
MRPRIILFLAAIVACGGAAEGDDEPNEPRKTWTAQKREDTNVPPVRGVATFTPEQALNIAALLARTGHEQARLGETRASSMDVKTYAATMTQHHARILASLAAFTKDAVANEETLDLLGADAERSLDVLRSAPPKQDVDLYFMTAEMMFHARTLALLDASLLPSAATDAAAVRVLMEMRAAVADHLVHALRVQGVVRAMVQSLR